MIVGEEDDDDGEVLELICVDVEGKMSRGVVGKMGLISF